MLVILAVLCARLHAHRPLFHPLALRGTDTDADTESPSPSHSALHLTHTADMLMSYAVGLLGLCCACTYRPPRPVIRHLHCVFPLLPLPFACRQPPHTQTANMWASWFCVCLRQITAHMHGQRAMVHQRTFGARTSETADSASTLVRRPDSGCYRSPCKVS